MKTRFSGFEPIRHDRLIEEFRHDPYQARLKLHEPTCCPTCGAVYHEGRWQWLSRPEHAHEVMCPACWRIHEEQPAGFVTLSGPFFKDHREELLHLVNNVAERAKAEHPMKRIMKIQQEENSDILITTTEIHLARGLGEALHHAYQGELEFHYNAQEELLRVVWER